MDLATQDLYNYQVARQLQLLPQLLHVFTTNSCAYPCFYSSLHPTAKKELRIILLCLYRAVRSRHEGAFAYYGRPAVLNIISFLSFEGLHVEATAVLSRMVRLQRSREQAQASSPQEDGEAVATPARDPEDGTSMPMTPLRLDTSTAGEGVDSATGTPARPSGSAFSGPGLDETPTTRASQALPSAPADSLYRPLFFLRPRQALRLSAESDSAVPPATHHIFVRMVHPTLLNEESLNTYFGRYGQVGVQTLRRVPFTEYTGAVNPDVVQPLVQSFPEIQGDPSRLYLQDFLISVDSTLNAGLATQRAQSKELLFIALHDPDTRAGAARGSMNTYSVADLDALMMDTNFIVWRLHGGSAVAPRKLLSTAELLQQEANGKRARQDGEKGKSTREQRRLEREGRPASPGSSGSRSDTDSESGSGEEEEESSAEDVEGFVPDIVIDGFPFWTTEDQLRVLLQEHGTVVDLQLSMDDLSGAFTGCVLVHMSSVEEAVRVANALHEYEYGGTHRLVSGVVNNRLDLVAVEDGQQVRSAAPRDQRVPKDITTNEQIWV